MTLQSVVLVLTAIFIVRINMEMRLHRAAHLIPCKFFLCVMAFYDTFIGLGQIVDLFKAILIAHASPCFAFRFSRMNRERVLFNLFYRIVDRPEKILVEYWSALRKFVAQVKRTQSQMNQALYTLKYGRKHFRSSVSRSAWLLSDLNIVYLRVHCRRTDPPPMTHE